MMLNCYEYLIGWFNHLQYFFLHHILTYCCVYIQVIYLSHQVASNQDLDRTSDIQTEA
jgi:hypothetical protein